MQAEVGLPAADGAAHQRARAVASDDVAGVELAHVGDLATKMDRHIREALDAGAQDLFEIRLVKIPVARPAMRPGSVDAAPNHQGLAAGIDEMHALRRGPRRRGDLLRQPH